MNRGVHLRVGHQHSQFWPILASFVDYYSLLWGPRVIWGPGVISTINEPWGAFMCRSSILTVLADFSRFVDYYSPFWGPKVIFTVL